MTSTSQAERERRYLLGAATEEESAVIEQEYLANAADVGSITLQAGGVVKGTLFDGSGATVPRGMVRLLRADHDETFTSEVRPDAQGNYASEHVKPGPYRLSATRGNDAATARLEQFRGAMVGLNYRLGK